MSKHPGSFSLVVRRGGDNLLTLKSIVGTCKRDARAKTYRVSLDILRSPTLRNRLTGLSRLFRLSGVPLSRPFRRPKGSFPGFGIRAGSSW